MSNNNPNKNNSEKIIDNLVRDVCSINWYVPRVKSGVRRRLEEIKNATIQECIEAIELLARRRGYSQQRQDAVNVLEELKNK